MNGTTSIPRISVVIPTFNRAMLLRSSLQSLARQTLPPEQYEIVVVNDGSTDETVAVCQEFGPRLRLRCLSIVNSGNSAAKNLGIFTAAGPIVLLFDDDDLAKPNLLSEHLRAHADHPDETVAVLGYTCWGPGVRVTPVMEYVIDIGQFLFAYKNLRDGQKLDYTYFWAGRISCKRSFLVARGVFNQEFPSIIEDIELGYRLSKHGLRVVFCRSAVNQMIRPITFDQFCSRCERLGRALALFSRLHTAVDVQQYCQVANAFERWNKEEHELDRIVRQVREIEAKLDSVSCREKENLLHQLKPLYHRTFNAFRLKGTVAALRNL